MSSSTRYSPTNGLGSSVRAERSVTDRTIPPTWRSELVRIADLLGSVQEARILCEEVARTRFATLVLRLDEPILPDDHLRLLALATSRAERVPLQHLVGHWPFRNLELTVDRRALIPRPETEEVVGLALGELSRLHEVTRDGHGDARPLVVVDLGTGSGAIACAIADEDGLVTIVAVDRSRAALALAAENVGRLPAALRARIALVHGSWYSALEETPACEIDCIVANPPYVSEGEWRDLEPVVRDHDPYSALVSGPSGLEDLERIIAGAPGVLAREGALVCEIGATQADVVRALAVGAGFQEVEIARDRFGRDRVLVARSPRG